MSDNYTSQSINRAALNHFLVQFREQRQLASIAIQPELLKRVSIEPSIAPKSTLVEYMYGVTIAIDPFMPKDEIQLRNTDGSIIARLVIKSDGDVQDE